MKTHPNLQNFFYLLFSGLLIHFVGTVYRIWLARTIGAEGLGLFQMAYPIYRLLSSMAAIGLPLALIKWVAEYNTVGDFQKIQALRRWSVRVVMISSSIAAGILLLTAVPLSTTIFAEPRVKVLFFILVAAIPFSALSSIYRGYFQGFSLMVPTAVSEITEQIAEVSFTYLGLVYLCSKFPFGQHIYPIIGLTIGEVVCFGTLIFFIYYHRTPSGQSLKNPDIPHLEIFNFAWPLLINQIVGAVGMSSEAALIPRLLTNTYSSHVQSTQWFGILTGMASPVAYFPLIFMFPLATVLLPQISSALKNNLIQQLSKKLFRFYSSTLFLSITGWFFIFFQAAPLSKFLYHSLQPVSQIRILVIGLPFIGLANLNLTFLTAAGVSQKILSLSLWSIGLKTALFFILIPHFGIEGAAWSMTISQIFIFLVSLFEVQPYLKNNFARSFEII